ncbi:MAG: pyridoxal-phosphate dependent enzyme, partial [Anaerolineales bacterium]|nr:pyridoxal-phosphate dependent enzyme [Anaerolineales bacterium]
GGRIIAVSDDEILSMQRRLAGEGIWVEPASAAGLAGLQTEIQAGKLDPKKNRIVAVCTGHGLKDPDIITRQMATPTILPPKIEMLEEVILN